MIREMESETSYETAYNKPYNLTVAYRLLPIPSPQAQHNAALTRPSQRNNLALEDCNCAFVGTGYQFYPPRILAAEKTGFSEVVTISLLIGF